MFEYACFRNVAGRTLNVEVNAHPGSNMTCLKCLGVWEGLRFVIVALPGLFSPFFIRHALRQYIDSETNRIRHVIKIPYINKVIEFINLPSISRDKFVISSTDSYSVNTETLIRCYKYNKPIRY